MWILCARALGWWERTLPGELFTNCLVYDKLRRTEFPFEYTQEAITIPKKSCNKTNVIWCPPPTVNSLWWQMRPHGSASIIIAADTHMLLSVQQLRSPYSGHSNRSTPTISIVHVDCCCLKRHCPCWPESPCSIQFLSLQSLLLFCWLEPRLGSQFLLTDLRG